MNANDETGAKCQANVPVRLILAVQRVRVICKKAEDLDVFQSWLLVHLWKQVDGISEVIEPWSLDAVGLILGLGGSVSSTVRCRVKPMIVLRAIEFSNCDQRQQLTQPSPVFIFWSIGEVVHVDDFLSQGPPEKTISQKVVLFFHEGQES